MTIKTSKATRHIVEWIDTPVQDSTKLYLRMEAHQTLKDAVNEFDGMDWIQRFDEDQGDKRFEGYNRISLAQIDGNNKLTIVMVKEETK